MPTKNKEVTTMKIASKFIFYLGISFLSITSSAQQKVHQYVDPMIGSEGVGRVFIEIPFRRLREFSGHSRVAFRFIIDAIESNAMIKEFAELRVGRGVLGHGKQGFKNIIQNLLSCGVLILYLIPINTNTTQFQTYIQAPNLIKMSFKEVKYNYLFLKWQCRTKLNGCSSGNDISISKNADIFHDLHLIKIVTQDRKRLKFQTLTRALSCTFD